MLAPEWRFRHVFMSACCIAQAISARYIQFSHWLCARVKPKCHRVCILDKHYQLLVREFSDRHVSFAKHVKVLVQISCAYGGKFTVRVDVHKKFAQIVRLPVCMSSCRGMHHHIALGCLTATGIHVV